MIQYISTTGGGKPIDFRTAVLNGKAANGGLYVPTELPKVSMDQLRKWKNFSYTDLAFEILSLFITPDIIPERELKQLINKSFQTFTHPNIIPHHPLQHRKNIIVQELFHGPTLSFKDVAMGFVVNLFEYFLSEMDERMTIMVATSGDTGPAAAFASRGKKQIDTWLLYPEGLISEEQRRQMTCIIDPNVRSIGVSGCENGSDDLDMIIFALFDDIDFKEEVKLSSVNSINWARVMMQTVHYFYGYLQHAKNVGDEVNFSVPCGAFGNMCAGSMAKRMGLPVGKMIVSSNSNAVLSEVFSTGRLPKKNIVSTPSSAIDIAVPMNFWRHLFFSLGGNPSLIRQLFDQYEKEEGITFSSKQFELLSEGFVTYTVSDEETLNLIKAVYEQENYLLDPHGAVAVAGALHDQRLTSHAPTICLATAHPSKFPLISKDALGKIPEAGRHASIEAQRHQAERIFRCDFGSWNPAIPNLMRSFSI